MIRRAFLVALAASLTTAAAWGQLPRKRTYKVRLRTRSKSVVSTTVQASDESDARYRAGLRYPNSTILSVHEVKRNRRSRDG